MSQVQTRPNIVLIVSDDHGREAVGCYGNTAIETPHLDALAAGGVRFTQAFCTTASCAASRSTILTGLHNHTNGTYGHTHGAHHFSCFAGTRTLPALMDDAGYRTGCIGKKHYSPKALFPFRCDLGERGHSRDDVAMAEACRDFIATPEPFLLYWCSFNPHRGRIRDDHPLRIDNFGNPPEAFPGDSERVYDPGEVAVPPFLSDTPEVRAELAQYYQSISRLDRGVGRLLDILDETGKADSTVVMYLSDNGAAFPASKTTLYEPGMRLPLIVRSPLHQNRGTTCDGLVTWADLTPTVLDLAGVESEPDAFFGRSFAPIVDEPHPDDWRDEIYAAHSFHEITNYYPMRVVRTRRHKFLWNIAHKLDYSFASDLWASASWQGALRDGRETFGARSIDAYLHRPAFELYDLDADPDETENLVDRPEYADLVASFKARLRRFQQQTRDPWLHKWTYE